MDELKRLLQNDPGQLQSFGVVEPIISEHLKAMKDMVNLGDKRLFRGSSQRELSDKANPLMQQIRATLNSMEKEQRARLNDEQTAAAAKAQHVSMLNLAISIVSAVLLLACGAWVLHVVHDRGKTEEKLDRLLNSMPDALLIINGDGKIVSTNAHAEKLFGYSDRELQGEKLAVLVPERFRQAQRQHYGDYFSPRAVRAPMTIELCGLRKDGEEFPIEVSTKPLVAEKGLVVTSAIRDITERKRVEQQITRLNQELEHRAKELEAANKELEAFSYSVSHDLRSPLQNIDCFSQILMENYAKRLNAEGRDYIQRMRACCQSMDDIIDALLVLSNINR
ncbi:MAG TPA: PAS domain S-box protein, partial [Verrucomicrobiae bacterium]|nr:PAS domain S-box protein [Verrucomicrobiae bacterium]